MTKKGRILVNLGQLEDDPPINGNANLKFLECENAKNKFKKGTACVYHKMCFHGVLKED